MTTEATKITEEERIVVLSKIKRKELISIGKNLKIKYLTQMKKEEIITEIIGVEFQSWENEVRSKQKKYMCEHTTRSGANKQKYKCVLCDGSHMCKHKKQKASCKKCREELESLYMKLLLEKIERESRESLSRLSSLEELPGIYM